jgi:Natural resistance-associated macrophage protein-like
MSAMPLGDRDMSEVLKSGSVRGVLKSAVLDDAHIGDIHGAFGTIRHDDLGPRANWRARGATLLAILGPGLIVMVGDNDAGAFGTYTQAGQNYGTTLLWTLMLLIPVLYVNQEMVLRLGAVSGVGHARLILERFGKFWGAFSVIDLFLLNSLTIVTEFIGISLALDYLTQHGSMPVAWASSSATGNCRIPLSNKSSRLIITTLCPLPRGFPSTTSSSTIPASIPTADRRISLPHGFIGSSRGYDRDVVFEILATNCSKSSTARCDKFQTPLQVMREIKKCMSR